MEDRIRELDPSRPFFDFLTDWLDAWVAYFADHPHERALHAAATLEVDTEARVSVQNVIHRHYLEVLRPLVRDAHARGDLRADSDTDALMSLLLMIFPHLALAPYLRGLDPILGLDEPTPEQPALAVRRLVAVLAAAFAPAVTAAQSAQNDLRRSSMTRTQSARWSRAGSTGTACRSSYLPAATRSSGIRPTSTSPATAPTGSGLPTTNATTPPGCAPSSSPARKP